MSSTSWEALSEDSLEWHRGDKRSTDAKSCALVTNCAKTGHYDFSNQRWIDCDSEQRHQVTLIEVAKAESDRLLTLKAVGESRK